MAGNTVEQIFVELLLNAKGYNKDADDAIKKSEGLEQGLKKTEKQSGQTNKSLVSLADGLKKTLKGIAGLSAAIAAGTGLLKLADEARKANDELNFLSKNLGMSANEVKAFQGAAAAMGGSAKGMASDMQNLNLSMNDFAMTGESSMLPMFNTLGVSMVDAQGKVRGTNDVMLDLADSMSKMDRQQGFLMGKKMGFDEGTINTLLQGRDAMQKMVDYHKQMYSSSKEELEASRKLSENQAKLGAHWESMKLMMANAIIPLLVKLSDVALKFFEFLQRHQKTVKVVFEGMAIFLGMLVIPLLGKALVAALAFIAPFAPFILTVGLLAAAFVLLYDDYKVWAEGGKSLFDWGAFRDYIDKSTLSTDNLRNAFKNLTRDMLSNTIPTLKGYADIVKELSQGNFKVAGSMAKDMMANLGRNIGDKIDNLTGNKEGSFIDSASHVFDGGGSKGGGYTSTSRPSGNFSKDKAASIARVAKNIGVNPNHLAAVISFETGGTFSQSVKNPHSSATGLIQFMAGSGGTKGKYYGMTRAQFAALSFDQQMNYVEKYFKERDKRFRAGNEGINTVGDVYGAVSGYGYKRGTEAYRLNRVWDSNGNGVIEKGEMVQNPSFRKHQRNYFSISQGASQAQHAMPKAQVSPSTRNSPNGGNTHNVDVKVQNINVNTTASTVTGTMNEAGNALKNGMIMYQYPIGIPT